MVYAGEAAAEGRIVCHSFLKMRKKETEQRPRVGIVEITPEIKRAYLAVRSLEEYNRFTEQYHVPAIGLILDDEMERKTLEIARWRLEEQAGGYRS